MSGKPKQEGTGSKWSGEELQVELREPPPKASPPAVPRTSLDDPFRRSLKIHSRRPRYAVRLSATEPDQRRLELQFRLGDPSVHWTDLKSGVDAP